MAGSPQWHAEQPYVQECFPRAGMDDLLLTTSIREVSEVTGHSNTLCDYCKLYHFKNEHQANLPPLSFSCFLAFWAECCGAEHSQLSWGRHFAPHVASSYLGPSKAFTACPLAPCSSHNRLPCHEEHHIFFFWLAAAVQTAWSSMSPLKEQYLCSSYTRYQSALVMFKKRTLVSFPVHYRRHMFGISIKSGNHVKLFEVLGSVQKALKTDDLKPWDYFNLPTLISAKNSTCEKNKPKLLLFY